MKIPPESVLRVCRLSDTNWPSIKVPPQLERITDVVLAYHPKPKTKAATRRIRKRNRKTKG